MSKVRTPLKTVTEKNYKMFVAGRERILPEVVFTVGAFDEDDKGISAAEYKRIYAVLSKDILAKLEAPLLYEELELLRKHFNVTQAEVAKVLGVDESTVSKWRKQQGAMEMGNGRLLKEFFIDKLYKSSLKEKGSPKDFVIFVNGEKHKLSSSGNVFSGVCAILVNAIDNRQDNKQEHEFIVSQNLEKFLVNSYESDKKIITTHSREPFLYSYGKFEVDDYLQEG